MIQLPYTFDVKDNVITLSYKEYKITKTVILPNTLKNERLRIIEDEKRKCLLSLRKLMYPKSIGDLGLLKLLPNDVTTTKKRYWIKTFSGVVVEVGKVKNLSSTFKDEGCGIVGFLTTNIIKINKEKHSIADILFIEDIK